MNSQNSWNQPEWDALLKIWLWFVNHMMFAADICVFGPSTSGLQCLLNMCGDYAAEHEIAFNCNKTIGVFVPISVNNLLHQMFFWSVYVHDFLTKKEICWGRVKCFTEGWWWYPETSEIAVLCSKQAQGKFVPVPSPRGGIGGLSPPNRAPSPLKL